MDTGGDVAWTTIAWVTDKPSNKELPNNATTETAYTNGNANMTSNVLLMHMNEAAGAINDTSGDGDVLVYNGTSWATSYNGTTARNVMSLGVYNGKLYAGLGTDPGMGDIYEFNDTAWSLSYDGPGSAIMSLLSYNGKLYAGQMDDNWGMNGNCNVLAYSSGGAWTTSYNETGGVESMYGMVAYNSKLYVAQGTGGWPGDGNILVYSEKEMTDSVKNSWDTDWHHIAATYDGANMKMYVDGFLESTTASAITINTNTTSLLIGKTYDTTAFNGSANESFNGNIDEVAMFNRVLSATEITDHYKRGAVRLKYQVRSCNDGACAGESFIGPDGTAGTYYSELSNSTISLPSLALTNVINNRYFQYKTFFETDSTGFSPELKSINIGPAHYDAGAPTIVNNAGQTYLNLANFTELLGGSNAGIVNYQISNNGTNWYYWNGVNWVIQTGAGYPTETISGATLATNISQFVTDIGVGTFYIKSFLISNLGTQQVEIDQLDIDYATPIAPATPPAASNDAPTFAGGMPIWMIPQQVVPTTTEQKNLAQKKEAVIPVNEIEKTIETAVSPIIKEVPKEEPSDTFIIQSLKKIVSSIIKPIAPEPTKKIKPVLPLVATTTEKIINEIPLIKTQPIEPVIIPIASETINLVPQANGTIQARVGEKAIIKKADSITNSQDTIKTIANKPIQLTIKIDQPISAIQGSIIFKSKKTKAISRDFSLQSFLAALFSTELASAESVENIKSEVAVGEFNYIDKGDGTYFANVESPDVPGEYNLVAKVNFANQNIPVENVTVAASVDEEGYIYSKDNHNQESRVALAKVSLFQFNPTTNKYDLWLGAQNLQVNPQVTDANGAYSFFPPADTYYLKVEAPYHSSYQSKKFTINQGESVHEKIELNNWLWQFRLIIISIMTIIIFSIALFYYHKNKKQRILEKVFGENNIGLKLN